MDRAGDLERAKFKTKPLRVADSPKRRLAVAIVFQPLSVQFQMQIVVRLSA